MGTRLILLIHAGTLLPCSPVLSNDLKEQCRENYSCTVTIQNLGNLVTFFEVIVERNRCFL